MKKLKHIRILVSLVMAAECIAAVLLSVHSPEHARFAADMQLSGSVIAVSAGASIGAWVLWLTVTLLLGRVYCSWVCPAGVLQDAAGRVRTLLGRRWKRRGAGRLRWHVLALYACGTVAGIGVVPLVLEPWPAFANIVTVLGGAEGGVRDTALILGAGAAAGLVCAALSAAGLLVYALLTGRGFCNDVCPVGSLLSLASARPAMHLELLPDRCTGCLRCEDVCKAGCIDIKARIIDDSRCVRCFNCINECDDEAIRYQLNPGGIVTPMMKRLNSSFASET